MKNNKTLGLSIISVVLSIVLLAGTTFAWFTDTVENKENVIQIGSLVVDLEKYKADADSDDEGETVNDHYVSIAGEEGKLFNDELWAPGMMQIVYLKAQNAGNLALDYSFILNVKVPEGQTTNPADAFEYAIIDAKYGELDVQDWTDVETAVGADNVVALKTGITQLKEDVQLAAGTSDYFALVLYMKNGVNNDYQNGELKIDVQLAAKQSVLENDALGDGFDSDAEYGAEMLLPEVQPGPQEPVDLFKEDFEGDELLWSAVVVGTGAVATSDEDNKYVVTNSSACGTRESSSQKYNNPGFEGGKNYKISFWIKNEACACEGGGYAHPRVGIEFFKNNGTSEKVYEYGTYVNTEGHDKHCIRAGQDGEWEQYEIEFTALDCDTFKILLQNRRYDSDTTAHGKILIDDITINPVE